MLEFFYLISSSVSLSNVGRGEASGVSASKEEQPNNSKLTKLSSLVKLPTFTETHQLSPRLLVLVFYVPVEIQIVKRGRHCCGNSQNSEEQRRTETPTTSRFTLVINELVISSWRPTSTAG